MNLHEYKRTCIGDIQPTQISPDCCLFIFEDYSIILGDPCSILDNLFRSTILGLGSILDAKSFALMSD